MGFPPVNHDRRGPSFRPGSSGRAGFGIAGFTVIEVAITLLILGILAAIAIPSYRAYTEKNKVNQCIADIKSLGTKIKAYELERGLPESLAVLKGHPFIDPWGNPYWYLNLTTDNPPSYPNARRDRNLRPLSTDFDLYSMGADKKTVKPVNQGFGKDDVIRADNGRFVGLGVNY